MNAKQRRRLVRKHKENILSDNAVGRLVGRRSIYEIIVNSNLAGRLSEARGMYRTAALYEHSPNTVAAYRNLENPK